MDNLLDRVFFIFLMVVVLFLCACLIIAVSGYFSADRYYANSAVVVEINRENDSVTCEDYNGTLWVFEGAEDWQLGDGVSLVMDDMGTPGIYDDEIKDARYTAWVFSK